jgi:hypothetical protein
MRSIENRLAAEQETNKKWYSSLLEGIRFINNTDQAHKGMQQAKMRPERARELLMETPPPQQSLNELMMRKGNLGANSSAFY